MQKKLSNNRLPLESSFTEENHSTENRLHNATKIRELILQEKVEKLVLDLFSLAANQIAENMHIDECIEAYLLEGDVEAKFRKSVEKIIGGVPADILTRHQTLRDVSEYIHKNYAEEIEYLYGKNPRPYSNSHTVEIRSISQSKSNSFKDTSIRLKTSETDSSEIPQTNGKNPSDSVTQNQTNGHQIDYGQTNGKTLSAPTPAKQCIPTQPNPVADGDIAIIGVSGRFPQASNLDEFWRNLNSGQVSITPIPNDRIDFRDYLKKIEQQESEELPTTGGFLTEIEQFDPLYFNISPHDAAYIDPQERIFLELVAIALENAGYGQVKKLGPNIGVYVAATANDYQHIEKDNSSYRHPQTINASSASIANRVSHTFDFQGPSMTIDTHGSSSLSALHLACQAIRSNEIEAAIVGGISLCLHPNKLHFFGQEQLTSSDGHGDSLDQAADGMVMGEGAGAILIKPLAKALADKDSIQAVVKASAVTHAGASQDYFSPNVEAFKRVLEKTYQNNKIEPSTINFIESHGQGCYQWDKAEIESLQHVFSDHPGGCAIGSIKNNIGNLETAAGIASLIKVILQLKHQKIASTPNSNPAHTDISLNGTPFNIPTQSIDWDPLLANDEGTLTLPRRAGINAFGLTGNHAHAILEQSPVSSIPKPENNQEVVILLSSNNREHLQLMARELLTFVTEASKDPNAPVNNLASLAFTLQVGRRSLEERLAFTVSSINDFAQKLEQLNRSNNLEDIGTVGNITEKDTGTQTLLEGSTGQAFLETLLKKRVLNKLSILWVNGIEIDWSSLYKETPHRISLPTYPFQRRSYWIRQIQSEEKPTSSRVATVQENDFIYRELTATLSEMLWMSEQDLQDDVALGTLGVDTELTHKFANRIQNRFGVRIHESNITEEMTLQQLTNHILNSLVEENLPIIQND